MPIDRISLYIELDNDEKVDLEVAARASIALAETVKEIAGLLILLAGSESS